LAAVFILYLLASEQLLLSESAAHHGNSWDAVFTIVLPAIQLILLDNKDCTRMGEPNGDLEENV
jgi:hypothetical protein